MPRYDNEPEPAAWLVENAGLLPAGRALDAASGNGRNAVYLAQLGFTVDGVDISEAAVATARAAAAQAGVSVNLRVADLEVEDAIPAGAYDVIICFNYLQRSLFPAIKAGLRRGGMVVYETFTADQARFGRPSNPEFLLRHNELLDMFRDFRCLRYREGIFGEKAVAGIVAEKV
jgi:tellurite methyltransferase